MRTQQELVGMVRGIHNAAQQAPMIASDHQAVSNTANALIEWIEEQFKKEDEPGEHRIDESKSKPAATKRRTHR